MSAPHPGTITFADEQGERVVPVSEVPPSVAFVTVGGQPVPVARVVAVTQGDRRELHSYAADGRLLTTTYQQAR